MTSKSHARMAWLTRTSCPLSPDIQHFSRKCQHPPTNILGRTFRPSWAFCVSKISLLLFLQLSTTRVSVTAMASYTHHLRTYARRKVQQSLCLSLMPTLWRKKGTVKLAPVSCAHTLAEEGYSEACVCLSCPHRGKTSVHWKLPAEKDYSPGRS